MASRTTLANQALRHLAYGTQIGNIETEQSAEAAACRVFFDTALDAILTSCQWPFAQKIAVLNLVEETPNDAWGFSYRLPADCIEVISLFNGVSSGSYPANFLPSHTFGSDSQGILLFTHEVQAQVKYVSRISNVNIFPPDFALAFTYLLASLIAPSITGGDQFKLGERAYDLYRKTLGHAQARALNQDAQKQQPMSGFVISRGT